MKTAIRRAAISDLELLMQWRMTVLREVFSVSSDCRQEELEQENRAYYQRTIPTGEHIACFAYADGEIVGCGGVCIYHEMPSPDNAGGACAYLMNIYTSPEVRRQGIGRAIVGWLIDQSKQRQISKIYLETSDAGRNLYREMNFEDMAGYMKLKESGEIV